MCARLSFLLILCLSISVMADPAADALAKESEAYCASTAKDRDSVTPQVIVAKVDAACKLLEGDGTAAFDKFKGNGSDFLFGGTYIWIHDMEGTMLMHPIKNRMEGKKLLGLKDRQGKMIFVEINKVAKDEGAGWVEYVWPKPGEKDVSPKTSYVKLVTVNGKEMVVGCGVYDLTLADVQATLK